MKSIIVVFVVASLSAVLGADYCLNTLCSAGVTHIACGHNGQFASTCPAGAHLIDITPHINNILSSHNIKRNTIAGGNLAGYLPAVRMAQMQWNTELAYLASLNVKQCIMKHDSCRNTATFKTSGQNLGSMGYSGVESRLNDSYIILDRIDAWWNEFTVANMNYINSYPSNYNGP